MSAQSAITAMAQKLGVQTQLQPTPSLALGTGAVTPLDMASVYATLAAGGVYSRPIAIRRVVFPGGKVGGGWGQPERTRVVPDWVAATVTHVLEENMLHGTGVGAHVPGRADAGKTGTTDDYADAWFAAIRPRSRPQSGWAIRRARSRCSTCTAPPSRARRCRRRPGGCSWSGRPSDSPSAAFPAPLSPAQFVPWTGHHAYRVTAPP